MGHSLQPHISTRNGIWCESFDSKNYLWYILRGNVPHFVTSQVYQIGQTLQYSVTKKQFLAKLQRVFEIPNITFSTHFEGLCTCLDILHTCTCTRTFDLHLSEEILCFWWVKIQVLRTIVLQQLSEAGVWGASPMDRTDPVLTHAHIPGRWYSSVF